MKRTAIILPLIIFMNIVALRAQEYKGVWEGFIQAEGVYHRGIVFDVKSQTGNIVSGRSYLFDVVKTGSSVPGTLRATMDFVGLLTQNNRLTISDLKILDSLILDQETFLWIKKLNLIYKKDAPYDVLVGSWNSAYYSRSPYRSGNLIVRKRIQPKNDSLSLIPAVVMEKVKSDTLPGIKLYGTKLDNPIVIDVKNYKVTITLRDYLREDLDTVSVYFNREKVISNKRITRKPYTKTFRLDKFSAITEVVVYAENLGLVPPNTCTMIVDDGFSKQRVNITSDKQTSAAVYLNYNPALPRATYDSTEKEFNELLQKSRNPNRKDRDGFSY
ncbi:hypothetical protein [Pedobacter sp. SYSU D00535]|uniref:hypothetical protein n=1 Tax=Pedobacter sp. SYSU D00535 TaxID=2810308 RepID=UPI001A957FEF|nr:hypothetical protein [Pedobacter sp. SYSU D00535]